VEHGNLGITDYGQMGITEDYLMWFLFMYNLESDYYFASCTCIFPSLITLFFFFFFFFFFLNLLSVGALPLVRHYM